MSNYFLNGVKLKYRAFSSYGDLTDFVNKCKIEKDEIQQIIQTEPSRIILLYWD